MRKIFFLTVIVLFAVLSISAQNDGGKLNSGVKVDYDYENAAKIQSIMDQYTKKDIPGIAVALYIENKGWWSGASGFSKTESKTPMTIDNLQYTQSVSKTYMAVAALKLYEEGRLDLDAPITKYISNEYSRLIKNAERITVRMLMNHTSGIAEYNSHPEYTSAVILNPRKIQNMREVIKCLANEEAQFEPGAKYQYTNTNYYLLTVIGDKITGDHAKYIEEKIFKPLDLKNTFYSSSKGYLKYPLLPDTYWDILGNGRPANITPMQVANVAALRGDDGIVATPIDVVKFLKGLVEIKLIRDSTLRVMQTWVKNDQGKPVYGLGLIRFEEGGMEGLGHGGGGLGAGCLLLYIPAKKTYVFLAVNIGLVIDGPIGLKVDAMKNELLAAVFN